MDDIDRLMEHTATSTIDLRLERLDRIHGVRAVLCLDELSGGIMHKCPDTFADIEAARHAVSLLDLVRRFRHFKLPDEGTSNGGEPSEPRLLSVRTRTAEYLLCPDEAGLMSVIVIQDLHPAAAEDAVSSLALRQLRIWEQVRLGQDQGIDWLFGGADE